MENSNLDFIINGELYLKREPEILNSTTNYIEPFDDEFNNMLLLDSYQSLKNGISSINSNLDYSGTDEFWQLFTKDGININLINCNMCSETVKSYSSKKALDRDFIKLSDFLEKATFVGRKFRRTKSISSLYGDDLRYMHSNSNNYCIALFCTRDLFLVKSFDLGLGERYKLINSRYTLDGNYEFFGPVYEEYRDKDNVYAEILQQVTQYNKGRGRL